MQSSVRARVQRQELWVSTGCEFHHVHARLRSITGRYSLTFSSCAAQQVTEFVVAPSRLPAEYDLCHSLNLSPSLHGLQTQTLFASNGSENYLGTCSFPISFKVQQRLRQETDPILSACWNLADHGLGIGATPIYSETRPAFSQFNFTQPTAASVIFLLTFFRLKPLGNITLMGSLKLTRLAHACFCQHLVKWTAAGETMTGDGSRLRGSKRLRTTTATATETAQGPQHGLRCHAKPTRNQAVKVSKVVLVAFHGKCQ
jgi:hypothetical protein